jgi:hypothetical protein
VASPVLALAQQQTLPEQWPQNPDAGCGTAVILPIIDEDMLDAGSAVHDDLLPAEDAAKNDVFFVSCGRKHPDCVVAQRAHEITGRRRFGGAIEQRRKKRLRFGHFSRPPILIPDFLEIVIAAAGSNPRDEMDLEATPSAVTV